MKIALIGFMGSGKTTIGKLLSEKLNLEFTDTDKIIEKETGMKISEIFSKYGEKFFREKERKILLQLTKKDNLIISTGGGLPLNENNMEILNKHFTTVYLKADFETLWNRIKSDKNRPLSAKGEKRLSKLLKFREKCYEKATFIVDTNRKTPENITSEIEKVIKKER